MTAPYILDREIEQLKALVSQLESRKRQQQKNNPQEQVLMKERNNDVDETSLLSDEVNRAIIDFVESKKQEKDGGPNQTQIVEEIRKKHATLHRTSRDSIRNRIESLVQFKVLIERHDAKYNQKRYYADKENLLLMIQDFFDKFEGALINLVNAFLEKKGPPTPTLLRSAEEVNFYWFVYRLYQHVSNFVVTRLTLEWPKMTNDPVLLDKLSRVVFAKLIELQGYISNALSAVGDEPHDNFFSDSWMLTRDVISKGIDVAIHLNLPEDRVEHVLNLAWKISAPYVRSASTRLGLEVTHSNIKELTSEKGWMSVWIDSLGRRPRHFFT